MNGRTCVIQIHPPVINQAANMIASKIEEISKTLSGLIVQLGPQLDYSTSSLLQDFMENKEYGVAYEWLQSVVGEKRLALTETQDAAMRRLPSLLGLPGPS